MEAKQESFSVEAYRELLKKERKANSAWKKLTRNKTAMVGLVIVVIIVLMAVASPLFATHDPNEFNVLESFLEPGENGHLLGTDELGRDLYSRLVYGARMSIIVAVGCMLVGASIGLVLGLVAGMKGGLVDTVIMRIMDGMLAFPFIVLALLLMTILGAGIPNLILAIGINSIPGYARLVRGQVHVIKKREYCDIARVLGESELRIVLTHVLPNIVSPLVVYATLRIAGTIISEAAISFLGIGIPPPTASWGTMLSAGKDCLRSAPHIATYSGLAILITVLGFNLLGDGVRDVLDPKMKR